MILHHGNTMLTTEHIIAAREMYHEHIGLFVDWQITPLITLNTTITSGHVISRIADEIRRGTQVFNLQELEG